MLSAIAIAAVVIGIVLGWKIRAFWENRPRIMRLGRKKKPTASAAATEEPSTGREGGLMNGLSKTGGKIVGKGVEAIFGKPKGPKDDKEKK